MKTLKIKKPKSAETKHLLMIGKTVTVSASDGKWLGVVKSTTPDAMLEVSPAMMREGRLVVNWAYTEKVLPTFAEPFSGLHVEGRKMTAFEERSEIGAKRQVITDDNGVIVDYMNVTINGYLSTFENVTAADRDGDYVKGTAFDKSMQKFSTNSVMLMDHVNDIEHLAGSFTELKKDKNGLAVIGKVSNAPELRKVRFLVAEKHLKTLSMGGLFLYGHDGKAIEEVDLWEGSLVPVPANQDAKFSVRTFDTVMAAKSLNRHLKAHKEVRGV